MAEAEVVVPLPNDLLPNPVYFDDPYAPVLYASEPVVTTEEQDEALKGVLALASSDTRFAQKAYDAIKLILGGGLFSGPPPVLLTVEPATGARGTTNLKVKCKGSGFDATCVIYMNGTAMPTSFTSSTEIFTNLNLVNAALGARTVLVRNALGVVTQTRTFTVV